MKIHLIGFQILGRKRRHRFTVCGKKIKAEIGVDNLKTTSYLAEVTCEMCLINKKVIKILNQEDNL